MFRQERKGVQHRLHQAFAQDGLTFALSVKNAKSSKAASLKRVVDQVVAAEIAQDGLAGICRKTSVDSSGGGPQRDRGETRLEFATTSEAGTLGSF